MTDIKVDPEGDIYSQTRLVRGPELVAQRVRIRLNTHRGEFPLDTRVGLPYIEWLGRKTTIDEVADAVRVEVESTPGVARLFDYTAELDGTQIKISAQVRLEDADELESIELAVEPDDGVTRVKI